MRLIDLAKELNITKQDIVNKLKSFHIKAKDELSDSVVAILKTEFKKSPAIKSVAKVEEKPAEKIKEKPVAIKKELVKEKLAPKIKGVAVEKKAGPAAKAIKKPVGKLVKSVERVVTKATSKPTARPVEKKPAEAVKIAAKVTAPQPEVKVAPVPKTVAKEIKPTPLPQRPQPRPTVKKFEAAKPKPIAEEEIAIENFGDLTDAQKNIFNRLRTEFITIRSDNFRIETTGAVNDITKKITVIYDRLNDEDKKIVFWHEG